MEQEWKRPKKMKQKSKKWIESGTEVNGGQSFYEISRTDMHPFVFASVSFFFRYGNHSRKTICVQEFVSVSVFIRFEARSPDAGKMDC